MRKTIFTILLFLTLTALLAMSALAQPGEGLIVLGTASAAPGESVTIPVRLEENPGVTVMRLSVAYDPALTLTAAEDKGLLGEHVHSEDPSSNPYILYWNNNTLTEDFTATGVLAELRFTVPASTPAGTYPVTVAWGAFDICNADMDGVPFRAENGSVTVTDREDAPPVQLKEFDSSITFPGASYVYDGTEKSLSVSGDLPEGTAVYYTNHTGTEAGVYHATAVLSCTGYRDKTLTADLVITAPADPAPENPGTPGSEGTPAPQPPAEEQPVPGGKSDGEQAPAVQVPGEEGRADGQNPPAGSTEKSDPESAAAWVNPFSDVREEDPFYEAVRFVNQRGLFIGVSDTQFAPSLTMTRAMFVTVLGRLAGVNTEAYHTSSFSDTAPGQWYSAYVEWAAENGIVLGYGSGKFGPDDLVTKEQAAVIIARYAEYAGQSVASVVSLAGYADAEDVSSWAIEAVTWAVENNIYVSDGISLSPREPASRAVVAMMMYGFAE